MEKIKRSELVGWLAKNRWVWTPYAILGVFFLTFINVMAIPYMLFTYQIDAGARYYKTAMGEVFALMLHRVE